MNCLDERVIFMFTLVTRTSAIKTGVQSEVRLTYNQGSPTSWHPKSQQLPLNCTAFTASKPKIHSDCIILFLEAVSHSPAHRSRLINTRVKQGQTILQWAMTVTCIEVLGSRLIRFCTRYKSILHAVLEYDMCRDNLLTRLQSWKEILSFYIAKQIKPMHACSQAKQ
jgi:hypothetical protein